MDDIFYVCLTVCIVAVMACFSYVYSQRTTVMATQAAIDRRARARSGNASDISTDSAMSILERVLANPDMFNVLIGLVTSVLSKSGSSLEKFKSVGNENKIHECCGDNSCRVEGDSVVEDLTVR